MRTKFSGILTLFLAFAVQLTFAQEKEITGTVTDAESGMPLAGVNIVIEGTTIGAQTDFDGNYSLQASTGQTLVFSYIGYADKSVAVGSNTTINVTMKAEAAALDQVVITALGIAREKKSLGYSTQEVSGDAVSDVPSANFVNSLSGKVAGLNISNSGTLGGSSNVVIRGSSSLTGSNQALFVINGVPVSNANTNTSDQMTGRGGYDYGNAAADINPNNIKSINVLKGAAATALYGSRAANGAIIIETKTGSKGTGIGVSVSSSITFSNADEETLPVYQDEYGAGYGKFYGPDNDQYFNEFDVNGDGTPDLTTPFTEDASFGARFDPDLMIYQWNSIYPQLDSYGQATPWVAAKHTPNDIWETGITSNNSFAIDGGTEESAFRLSVNNMIKKGALPNSEIKKNTISFNASHDFTDRFTAGAYFNFTKTDGQGRYGTGYSSNNIMQQFRQWFQTNVDVYQQKEAYFATRENITWNPNSPANLAPIYSDNPYWILYENYETDTRNRYFGNINLNYEISDMFSITGRFSFDTYDELREERRNVGSSGVASYSRFNNRVAEYNYDVILNFDKDLTEDINLNGNLGVNLRRNERNSILASTNGGLNKPGFYALSNSTSALLPPSEYEAVQMVDGVYARVSLGFVDTYYLEGTIRRDRSSTLPKENNTFYYPSISGNILLSNIIEADWLDFMKLRANYAEVGNATIPYQVFNTYNISTPFGGGGVASNNSQLNNLELKPERTKSYEIGLDTDLFDRRVGFDITYYNGRTYDQITPVPISRSTGFSTIMLNAGTIENKGIEAILRLEPIRTENFNWNITVNWAKNKNEVIELEYGIKNLQLAGLQGGISINATPGQPYGTIRGSDYVYDDNGNKMVGADGYYLISDTNNEVIGSIQPDWTGGIQNSFSYKNLSLSFLIDMQKGGDVFSLDTWYGFATGLYDRTAGLNDLGNPVRAPLADGGGVILPGVTESGASNTTRIPVTTVGQNPWGYSNDANKGHVYDASFIKLREVSLTYNFGGKVLESLPFTNASLSLIGRNLWIIDKNIPYSDPEAGLSSGNVQGYQSGAYPTMKEIGFSVNLKF